MNQLRSISLSLLAIIILHFAADATTKKVLFIGNSYTYTNNMPAIFQSIAAAYGDTVIFDQSDPGGYTMAQHCTNTTTIAKIFSQQWDIVVIQDQSELPSFPPAEVDTEVYPYAHKLDSMVHANDTCTQTMFMMTWGHANGDPANCTAYPVICTYDGMQERLRESYLQMGIDNHADVAPAGMAFKVMMDSAYAPWLYSSDSSHPIVAGSYLEACVLYSSIFHKSTLGCTYTDGLTATDAYTLQRVATKVVFDSLTQWQGAGHYPYAGFVNSVAGMTATFTALSPVAQSYSWSFGDGGTSTVNNPLHTYTSSGSYVVTLTASTGCFTETLTDTVHVGTTNINNTLPVGDAVIIMQQSSGKVTIQFPSDEFDQLDVYDGSGRMIRSYKINELSVTDTFIPGMYIYRLHAKNSPEIVTGKMSVY